MAHVLYHRPTVWASDVQCSTKVLARLTAARGHQTDYVQAPLDPVHLIRGKKGYLPVWKDTPRVEDEVRIATQATPVPVRDIWPLSTLAASSLRYRLSQPRLSSFGSPDLVWTTVPGSGRAMKRAFPKAKVVFHVVDYYPAFRGEVVRVLERDDYASVDAVATIGTALTRYLIDDLNVPEGKITTLGQGVETARYSDVLPEPSVLSGLTGPRAVWVGVLGKADQELFAEVAGEMAARGGVLILAGPGAPPWAEQLAQRFAGVVHFIGSVPPVHLPALLCHCDVGIMLYDRKKQEVYKGQNPLKLYEYAAAGLPILSTPHDEYDALDPPVAQVREVKDIAPALEWALGDAATAREAARGFAAAHSWDSKLDTIFDLYLPGLSKGADT